MAESTQRANAIARNIFSKFVAVVSNARITNAPEQDNVKQDKWFNLETPDPHLFKDNLRLYHSISTLSSPPPPLELQVLLSVPELTTNQALVLVDSQSSRARVVPTPRYVLLESWVLVFNPSHPESPSPYHEEVALSAVYKQSISLFRSLFTLMRVLPAWSLFKRLRRRGASSRTANLGIQVSIGEDATGILGFDKPLSPNTQPLRTSTHSFPSVSHPLGTLTLHTTYLNDSTFEIDTVESLLSSRFLSDDEFTPTLVSRNSLHSTSSPGSLPMRQSIPRPPLVQPTTTSIADRFILRGNANASNTSLTSPSPLPVASIPTSRQPSSLSSSPKDAVPFPNPNRVRRESLLSKHSALSTEISPTGVTPPSPQGVPLRRPSITSPFRGPTIASSPSSASFRQASPLSSAGFNTGAGASLPSRPPPVSPRLVPGTLRPSPPNQFTPSSLGDGGVRRSSFGQSSSEASGPPPGIGGATGTLPTGISRPTGKRRFSSTFGHRYSSSIGAASIGGSDGSGGSVEKKDVADALLPGGRPATGSYMSTATDEDDITGFVHDIESRSPLSVRDREPLSSRPQSPSILASTTMRGGLTNPSQVDEALKRMNETFQASLLGLGSGSSSSNTTSSSPGKSRVRSRSNISALAPIQTASAPPSPSNRSRTSIPLTTTSAATPSSALPVPRQGLYTDSPPALRNNVALPSPLSPRGQDPSLPRERDRPSPRERTAPLSRFQPQHQRYRAESLTSPPSAGGSASGSGISIPGIIGGRTGSGSGGSGGSGGSEEIMGRLELD